MKTESKKQIADQPNPGRQITLIKEHSTSIFAPESIEKFSQVKPEYADRILSVFEKKANADGYRDKGKKFAKRKGNAY